MLWVKAFHLIAMAAWFAGLFYLPRLFVYHADATDEISNERFKIMERKLYRGIMTPAAILTLVMGCWMLIDYAWGAYGHTLWLQAKLILILIMLAYHAYCGKILKTFKQDNNTRKHIFYRWFNEIPVLFLVAIILLAVIKPI
jgi:protoporphyrinogen IX oxidase